MIKGFSEEAERFGIACKSSKSWESSKSVVGQDGLWRGDLVKLHNTFTHGNENALCLGKAGYFRVASNSFWILRQYERQTWGSVNYPYRKGIAGNCNEKVTYTVQELVNESDTRIKVHRVGDSIGCLILFCEICWHALANRYICRS